MFDFGSGELLVIGVVALVVIGPKELPGLLRTVGQTVAKLRRMAGEFQGQFQDALREAELHDTTKSLSDIQTSVAKVTGFNDPLASLPTPTLPIPTLPEPPMTPPVELQPVAKIDEPQPPNIKPKRARAKKTTAIEMADPSVKGDPQVALFDTLDALARKTEIGDEADKPKVKRARKTKPKADEASE